MTNDNLALKDLVLTTSFPAIFLLALLPLELSAPPKGPVMVLTWPFQAQTAAAVISDAQGNLLELGSRPWIAVGTGSDDEAFRHKLKTAGAWLLLAPLTRACLTDEAAQTER